MIGLHGSYFDDNFGDLLLIQLFEKWIKEKTDLPIIYPLVPKREISRFRSHFPNASVGLDSNKEWKATVYTGGGHFGQPILGMNGWNKRFLKRHVVPAELSMYRKVPYAIFAVGAGPISNFLIRRETKRIFQNSEVLSVRDKESHEFINSELNLRKTFFVAPDAALTVNSADIPAQAIDKIKTLLPHFLDHLLLGVHHPRDFLGGSSEAKAMRAGLLYCLNQNIDVVPVVFADKGDIESANQCTELTKFIEEEIQRKCFVIPFQGVWETIALISMMSAVITSKLHVGILAYGLGVYCESFAIHPKTPRFYSQISRPRQCDMLHGIQKERVIEKLQNTINFSSQKYSIIDDNWHEIKRNSLMHRYLLYSFLETVL
jgi:polysaccharide pyruvyl transferase WcaK-like protein